MSWFFGGNQPLEQPTTTLKTERKICWETRDAYFDCLDSAGVVKAGQEGEKCASQKAEYQKKCAKSWVEYFNQRRILAEQQKHYLAQMNAQAEAAKKAKS